MSNSATVIAIQIPAACNKKCSFCRSPRHGEGDEAALLVALEERLPAAEEVYITSNGEPGFYHGFAALVADLISRGKRVSVLTADPSAIVPGLARAEVSLNPHTRLAAEAAIQKAKALGVPVVVSLVDDGMTPSAPEQIAAALGTDGIVVRALQREGRSAGAAGTTRVWRRAGAALGAFPVPAYQELAGFAPPSINLDAFGREVPFLGIPAAA